MVTRLMESSPSSRISFFVETGAPIHGPVEGRKCGVAIAIRRELWPLISLKLDTEPLPLQLEHESMCARAEWPPCGPGHYELVLTCGDIHERLSIKVLPQYFRESDFLAIVQDLEERMPKLISSQLQECGGLVGENLVKDQEPTIEQEFVRLRRAVAGTKEKLGVLQLLPMIQRDCYQVLVPRHELRKANQARKPDISKLPRAIAMPGNIFPSGALKQMYDMTVERSFETHENRLVKAYVQALQSQMSRLQGRLEAEATAPAIARELETLLNEFRLACTRASFLREVKQPFVSAGRVTMVLLKNPAYRAILEGYLALYKQSPIRLDEPALAAPLSNFARLYQRWANLIVVSVLLQVCSELDYQCVGLPWITRDNSGLVIPVMKEGEAGIRLSCPTTGRIVCVVPWKTDSGRTPPLGNGPELPPALAIAIYTPERTPVVLLYDAKYQVTEEGTNKSVAKKINSKTNTKLKPIKKDAPLAISGIAPMKQDIDELLHGMERSKTPDGGREIQYAAILYPGQRKQITADLEALSARPSDREALEQSIYDVLRLYLA